MAIDVSKLVTLGQLQTSMQRAKANDDLIAARVTTLEGSTHSHTNKTVLDGITAAKVEAWDAAQANVVEGVKVNGAALAIAEKIVDILIATGSTNGTIAVNGVDVSVAGLAAVAYKAEVSEADLATALAAKINAKAEASDLTTLSGKVTTLIGNETGDDAKSVRAISAEEVAKIVAGADTSYDTLKEIADWILSDTTGAAKMNSDISALKTKLTLGTYDDNGTQVEYATVRAYVEAVVAGLGMGNYYNKSDVDGLLNDKVDKNGTDRLMTVAEGTKLNGIWLPPPTATSRLMVRRPLFTLSLPTWFMALSPRTAK